MSLIEAIILGIIQGLTEFLPISSSAHLVVVPFLFNWQIPEQEAFVYGVLVQMGTLLAVIIYFWKDLVGIAAQFVRGLFSGRPFNTPQARMGWYLILATVPAGLFGLLVKEQVEQAFSSPQLTAVFLLITAGLLFTSDWLGKGSRTMDDFAWKDALWMGCAQALSIFPGVSRSGSTMAGGVSRNLDRPSAARFSFLMSIPIMIAAGLLTVVDLLEVPNLTGFLPSVSAGFVTAAGVGYLSIRWLLAYLVRHSFKGFAYYCIAISVVTLVLANVVR